MLRHPNSRIFGRPPPRGVVQAQRVRRVDGRRRGRALQGRPTWSEAITRAKAGDFDPPPGQPPLRPGERGSAATAQRAIDFRQGMGKQPFSRPLSVITSAYTRSC